MGIEVKKVDNQQFPIQIKINGELRKFTAAAAVELNQKLTEAIKPPAASAGYGQWIPVDKELPKISQDVIATDGETTECGFYSAVDERNHSVGEPLNQWCDFFFEVTHWMPLPEPPKP